MTPHAAKALNASVNDQARAWVSPVRTINPIPSSTEMFSRLARTFVSRVRPSAISPAARTLSIADAGIPAAIIRTNCNVSTWPSGENPPTSAFTQNCPSNSIAPVSTMAITATAIVNAPRLRGASVVFRASRCMGIMIAGTLSFCSNASGMNTAASAPRKPSATSEAPNTCAIKTSRPKPSNLLVSAPLIRIAVKRRIE
jgi:hypothetical protein